MKTFTNIINPYKQYIVHLRKRKNPCRDDLRHIQILKLSFNLMNNSQIKIRDKTSKKYYLAVFDEFLFLLSSKSWFFQKHVNTIFFFFHLVLKDIR